MNRLTTACVLLFVTLANSCGRTDYSSASQINQQPVQPVIEIAPLERGHGQWQVASTSAVTVTVTAPGANLVLILSRPEGVAEGVEEEQLELKRMATPTNAKSGKFVTPLELPSDFAGEVWAEAVYADGAKKQTEAVALTAATPGSNSNASPQSAGGSIGTDESARSDKLTGGRVKRASFQAGQSDIRLTINLPAFMLTLWQNGAEVGVYRIGIGRKSFP
ncbi:MAG: L,D-transpeptidase, partial [Acidobacteriota bacterium]